jgi:nucleoside-diphosphate-sugar epimerase
MVHKGQTQTHLIYFSTFHVYGAESGNVTEDSTALLPKNDYGISHLFAEYYIRQFHQAYNIPYTIFRLTNSYGCPKEINNSKWYLVVNDLAKNAAEKKSIILNSNGQPRRDFIWMGDVCTAVDKCISKGPANSLFNLGMGKNMSMMEVAEIVQKAGQEYFSDNISIVTNSTDKKNYDNSLTVSVDKIKNWINFSTQDKMKDEVLSIFKLLTIKN